VTLTHPEDLLGAAKQGKELINHLRATQKRGWRAFFLARIVA
jgi:hypothetical protein